MLEGKRILIVDDEFMIALMAEEMVRDFGATPVGPAASVEEAVSFARAGGFDAVLLDVNLNGLPSEGVARELRRQNIPFVVVTGYGAVSWAEMDTPVLMKPYDGPAIARALSQALAAGPRRSP
ncbi:MAG: response regulator [Vitreimonas sp.]